MSTLKTKIILLKELLALKEVVDKGSIQIAAGENGIKNSNLSQMIRNLEHRFHTKLINRGASGSLPTNSAQLIYNDICAIEEELTRISENFVDMDALSGSMSVWTEEGLFGSFIWPLSQKSAILSPVLLNASRRKIGFLFKSLSF